jgi:hypothetical protein
MKITTTKEVNEVQFIGHIWQGQLAAAVVTLKPFECELLAGKSRPEIAEYARRRNGDFESIVDFKAIIGETVLGWTEDGSPDIFADCMFPV